MKLRSAGCEQCGLRLKFLVELLRSCTAHFEASISSSPVGDETDRSVCIHGGREIPAGTGQYGFNRSRLPKSILNCILCGDLR
jgi:hypothetical protein